MAKVWVVYDGACPFCSRYVSLVRLRDAVGTVELVDARRGGPLVDEIRAAGLDLNRGMVLKMDGRLYGGADCIHRLALLSTRSDRFNRLTATLFSSPTAARLLYPLLRAGRSAILLLLGRSGLDRPDR